MLLLQLSLFLIFSSFLSRHACVSYNFFSISFRVLFPILSLFPLASI